MLERERQYFYSPCICWWKWNATSLFFFCILESERQHFQPSLFMCMLGRERQHFHSVYWKEKDNILIVHTCMLGTKMHHFNFIYMLEMERQHFYLLYESWKWKDITFIVRAYAAKGKTTVAIVHHSCVCWKWKGNSSLLHVYAGKRKTNFSSYMYILELE